MHIFLFGGTTEGRKIVSEIVRIRKSQKDLEDLLKSKIEAFNQTIFN